MPTLVAYLQLTYHKQLNDIILLPIFKRQVNFITYNYMV